MVVIPETLRVHPVKYIRFYYTYFFFKYVCLC